MVLQARYVRKARKLRECDACERMLSGPHIYICGMHPYRGAPLDQMRVHIEHCLDWTDPKVQEAIARARKDGKVEVSNE